MMKRNVLGILVALVTVLATVGTSSEAIADPGGTGHIYKCNRLAYTDDYYTIAFSKIYTCSDGPMSGPSFVAELSTYTGKQTGKISGECAWHAYHVLGWRNMTKVWNWCLTDPHFAS